VFVGFLVALGSCNFGAASASAPLEWKNS